MGEFTIEIARSAAAVSSLFGSTREYFKSYLTEKAPDLRIYIDKSDLIREQRLLDEEADALGLRRRTFTDPFLERAAIQRKMAAFVLTRNVLLLHGSTIAADGRAYLFTAASGVGKSTHTKLWQQMLGQRAVIINDDRAFLQITPEGIYAYGSPWSGKHGLDSNLCAPLAGICILERGPENRIRAIRREEAMPVLLEQIYIPDESCRERIGELEKSLAGSVPLWQMSCTREPEAAQMAYRAMAADAQISC